MKRLGLLALVACRSSEPPQQRPPPPPPTAHDAAAPAWNEALAQALVGPRADVAKAYLAMKALRKMQAEGDLALPDGPLPALDFTHETGDAILSSPPWQAREPITEEPQLRVVHLADDPYRLASLADGVLARDEDKATYRAARFRPALEHLARARHVVFVVGTTATTIHPARFDGIALVYELSSTQLLAGIPLHVTGRSEVRASTAGHLFRRLDPVVLDLEARVRDALWDGLRARAPAVKVPALAYVAIDD